MSKNECKNLNDILLDTVKELGCIMKERVKRLKEIELAEGKEFNEILSNTVKELSKIVKVQEQIKVSKHNTCCKCVASVVAAVVLCVVIFLCCFCQCNKKTESVPDTKPSVCRASCFSETGER